jgi:hypothetical protein
VGGQAATSIRWAELEGPGYQRAKSAARSSLRTRAPACRSRWAPRGDHRICCFLAMLTRAALARRLHARRTHPGQRPRPARPGRQPPPGPARRDIHAPRAAPGRTAGRRRPGQRRSRARDHRPDPHHPAGQRTPPVIHGNLIRMPPGPRVRVHPQTSCRYQHLVAFRSHYPASGRQAGSAAMCGSRMGNVSGRCWPAGSGRRRVYKLTLV